ncbi:MAG: DNA repair protein RecN [Coriobacteriia bacterium]
MLLEVHVRDLALIEEAWAEFGPGLNVLTGETGAGKTVLVGALELLSGGRADSSLVRSGADEALIEGMFVLDDVEVTVKRRVSAEGRSRCYLDGEMVSVSELAQTIGSRVDLHGQHDHQALLRPAKHLEYIVAFGGEAAADASRAYRDAFESAQEAARELAEVEARAAELARRREELEEVVREIDAVSPQEGEDDELEALLPRLRHAARLAEAVAAAYSALAEEGAGTDAIALALTSLRSVAGIDADLDAVLERLEALLIEAQDIASGMREYVESLEHDPSRLDEVQSRIAALDALKRKHGPTLAEVLAARQEAAALLADAGGLDGRVREASERLAAAEKRLSGAASDFEKSVRDAAAALTAEVTRASEGLGMGAARFDVDVAALDRDLWTAATPLRAEILFSSSEGDACKPLGKIASGGEVSRVMLALKTVFGQADPVPVTVFDEIDAGIGGRTARMVGARLAELARDRQVLVVTHLAQVAVFADRHLVVEKSEEGGRSRTLVRRVEGEERVQEIARMLAGSDTQTGLEHARELLAEADVVATA